MKLSIIFFVCILSIFNINSQNIIALQSFETSGDTWLPIEFSTPPCHNRNDIWDYSTHISGIFPSDQNQFWGIRNLDGSCGGNDFETITLPNIDISSFSNVIFSFDYYAIGFDNNDELKYELFFDEISQGEVIIVQGTSGPIDNTNGWITEIVNIPATITNVRVILSAKNDEINDRGAFDNVRLEESVSDNDCFDAINLTVGYNNTENVVSGNNSGATDSGELPIPNCANYDGNDVWYTAIVPESGILTVETLDAGSSIDTGIAIYTGSCGALAQIDCDDNSGNGVYSLINLTNQPSTTIYIRVWNKKNSSPGNFNIVAYTTLCPFTTTWTNSMWDNGTPNLYTTAIINGNYDTAIHGVFESCNCLINEGTTLNIRAADNLIVHNDLVLNGTLEVRNEASFLMTNNTANISITGILNVHKTSAPFNQYDYTYWSSPIIDETIGSALSTSIPNRIYEFNTAIYNELTTNGWTAVGGSTIMKPGTGYIAMGPTIGIFPQTQEVIFSGDVNNGTIQAPINLSADDSKDYEDWNLIGNPYPSGLNADLLLSNPLNTPVVGGSIYFWTHNTERNTNAGEQDYNSNDYATYTYGTGGVAASSGGEKPTGIIASCQSFFIDGITTGNITFNNAMRVATDNNQFFRTPETKYSGNEKDKIWLNLSSDKGAFNQLLIGFIEGATDAVDRSFDGLKFGGGWVSFYSIVEDKNLAVQGKSPLFDDVIVRLGFSSYLNEGEILKIGIAKTDGKLNTNEFDIFLKDKLLNTIHDLKAKDYEFLINEKGVFNNRFELIINKSNVLNIEDEIVNNQLLINNLEDHLTVSALNNAIISSFKAYDMLGKLIINESPNKNQFEFNIEHLSKGNVLLINAVLDNDKTIFKKVIILK